MMAALRPLIVAGHWKRTTTPRGAGGGAGVIAGPSERRRDACETDERIGRKIARALEHDLRPILAVGERLAEREAGVAHQVVRAQLVGALAAAGLEASDRPPPAPHP